MKQCYWVYSLHALQLLCLCIFSPESNARQAGFQAEENLVSFFPIIISPLNSECQGFRVTKSLVATSPHCAREIREILKKDKCIEVLDAEAHAIGPLSISNRTLSNQMIETSLFLLMHANDEYQFNPTYYTSKSLPEETFAFYLNEQNGVSTEEVFLSFPDSSHKDGYFVFESEEQLPEASPVVDANGNLVCLITSIDKCHTLPVPFTQPVKEPGFSLEIDYYTMAEAAIVITFLAFIVITGVPILKAVIPMGISIIWYIWITIASSPQGQCFLKGCKGDDCCCCS